ncbi:SLC13 family permease [Mycoplana rhizolycopersici]|jgi:di/tricarboxylate transporter|uniref:SLC13 family permease n=1 Tax=Mycoplana rhizolycopersici TaxID=2746702 RepID=A0ABX2QJ08_9HYPH|nr:SLC13 family permease [Rhizobium rhizolycopersici]NVP57326.1 SLC13 family permease [Rhizobium rhizolycopersici]
MSTPQILSFAIILAMMAAFVWGRLRYDVVACLALLIAIAAGIVPFDKAFSGFSDDIVIIVGSALVVSAAVARSGIINRAVQRFFPNMSAFMPQMVLLLVAVAVMSAFIKNIGALAIMMPMAFQFSRRSGVPVSRYLMPMAFAALLGGLMTQIGTSPNIVVSRMRQEITGESFTMFDFTPVGGILTVAGIFFLLALHKLVPVRTNQNPSLDEALELGTYSSDATVTNGSGAVGKSLNALLKPGHGDIAATAIIRDGRRMAPLPDITVKAGDTLLLEGTPTALDQVTEAAGLKLSGKPMQQAPAAGEDIAAVEVVVSTDSRLAGLSARRLALFHSYGINLLAVNRQGKRISERLSEVTLAPGDMLMVQGGMKTLPSTLQELGLLPLAQRQILLGTKRRAYVPLLVLAAAMIASATGAIPVATAFFAAAVAMLLLRVIPLADAYRAVDGPILVMLAALIPVADTLRSTGGSELIAGWLGSVASGLPTYGALAMILLTAMAVTPFLNNAATVLVMAPIAVSFASALDYRPEAFLMAVAIGAGCDFLTPIGHQCNTLVMGPGGYRFSDYPRLGLPLSLMIVLVSVPALLYVWPVN